MSGKLGGRRFILTGAAGGIGAATARLFALEGAKLALFDRDEVPLRSVADELGAQAFVIDLADEAALIAAVADAVKALGGLDGVVNNAGISGDPPFGEMSSEHWHRALAVNLSAPATIIRCALPHLLENEGSTVVNVASGQGLLPNAPHVGAYAASKGGLIALSRALGNELAPRVRVNAVAPGIVNTAIVTSVLGGYEDPDEAPFVKQYPMRRVARPQEIAEAILFLSSPASSYVTGTVLAVDGGRTLH